MALPPIRPGVAKRADGATQALAAQHVEWRSVWILGLVFFALHLPFLNQALIIDDGNFVDQALQILKDPGAPYSFSIRFARVEPFFDYFANPPGQAYWLAAAIALFGNSEPVLHGVCLLFSGLAVGATFLLGRELCGRGLYAALLLMALPAFQISSHTVMPDVPAAAFYVLAVYLLIRGVDEDHLGLLIAAGLAAGSSMLLKYSSLSLFPLMLLYIALRRRWKLSSALPILVAAALFGVWCWFSVEVYGRTHIGAAFALELSPPDALKRVVQMVASLIGLGGTTLLAPILLLGCLRRCFVYNRAWGVTAALLATAAFLSALPAYDVPQLAYALGNRVLGGLLFAAGIASFCFVLSCGASALRELFASEPRASRESARKLLLVAWVLGYLALNGWTLFATPKYLVPALAPLILLWVGSGNRAATLLGREKAIVGLTLAFGLLLSGISASQGNRHRAAVYEIADIASSEDIWFVGHWTVRHYSEQVGYRHLAAVHTPDGVPAPGDLVFVIPDAVWHPPMAGVRLKKIQRLEWPVWVPLHLSNELVRSGYWAHMLGVLPYVISSAPRSVLDVYRVAVVP